MENIVHNSVSILAGLVLLVSTSVASLPAKLHDFANKFSYQPKAKTLTQKPSYQQSGSVLAATFDRAVTGVTFTIPAFFKGLVKLDSSLEVSGDTTLKNLEVNGPSTFNDKVTLTNQDLDLGTGNITAANVLYGLTAGDGIKIGTGQKPTVSLNVDYVKSIDGLTGDVSLSAGSGINYSGGTITNSDKGSSQSIFKTFSVTGQSDIVADSNTDELGFIAGTGVTLTTDATNKTLTIDASSAYVNSGWADDGTVVRLISSTDKVGIGTSSPSQALDVGGLFVVDTANSFVGIGTTAPAYTLDNAGSLRVTGGSTLGTLSAGATTLASLNNSNGGITNAGAITGGTGFTSSGTITFASLGAGVAQLSSGGVLSSSALNLAGSNITGTLGIGNGGTGLTTFTTGDLLYGSATNTLGKIGIGSSGQVLTISGGIPTWGSITGGAGGGGGICTDCLVNDPGSTQSITPTSSTAVGLDVRQASSGSVDIFRVSSNNGATQYFRVDSTGNVVLGTSSSSGVFTVSPTSTDPIAISPVAQGSGAFTGTITSADLTAARTWTLPNATGSICLDTGNCAGSGGNLGGSGSTNYLARWNAQYVLENGSLYDNGNIGIGTTLPLAKFDDVGTAWLRGSGSTTGLYVASSGNVGIGTTNPAYNLDVAGTANVSGAVTLGSTLNVTGATTILSSTMSITGTTTVGGNLQVNGAGNSWVMGNFGIGTSSPTSNLSFGSASTVGLATSTRALNFQSGLLDLDTSNSRVGVGTTAPQATFDVTNNAISSGTGLLVSSTSTSFSSGMLASIDWSPSSSTTATGDLLSVNVGANGIVGNIFNVKDNGTSVFSVSQTAITAGLPVNFTAPGDVNIAYDLLFSNQTSGNIKSLGPLAIEAGEAFESNFLTLRTFNAGQLVLDLSGGLTLNQQQNWTLASNRQALNLGGILDIDGLNSRVGIGTTVPSYGLDVQTTAWLRGASGGASGLFVTGAGNVGIGITNAYNKLDVSGSVAFGSLPTSPLPQSNSAYFSGNVGIGTTNPSVKLDVIGKGKFYSTTTADTTMLTLTHDVWTNDANEVVNINMGLTYTDALIRTGVQSHGDNSSYVAFLPSSSNSGNYVEVLRLVGNTSTAAVTGALTVSGNTTLGDASADSLTINAGSTSFANASTIGLATSVNALNFQSGLLNLDTTNRRIGIGTTAPGANLDIGSSATTGIGQRITANSLTTGQGLSITSTSTALSTGSLATLDWSPGSSTTATGDMLSINVGANGIIGNIFNVKDNGTSVFSVSQTAITAGLPVNFTAPGDVGVAYDLNFTNQTASYIKSNAPLVIEVGESWESNDLTLRTFNAGQLVLDTPSGLTLNQAQQWTFATSAQALNISNGLMNFDTTNARVGIGTSIPGQKFDVANKFVVDTTNTRVGIGTTAPGSTLTFANNATVGIASNAIDALNFSSGLLDLDSANSRIGIGTTGPTYKLDIAGTLRATGSVALGTGNNSYVGIGTASAVNKLDVNGSVAFGSLPTTALPQANSAYFSGNVGIGTTNPTSSLQIVGGNCSDDAGGGGCTADYAELYPASENVEKGDVLMIDSSVNAAQATVKRANKAYAGNLIGIVSSAPAAIADGSKLTFMNNEYKLDPRRPAVALAGRVPVKIDPDSPSIIAGDMLTSSNKPGMAMKATKAGPIIGKALESWTPSTTNNSPATPQKILVFVTNAWADPALALNETGEVAGVTSTMASVSPDKTDDVAKMSVILSETKDLGVKVDDMFASVNTLDSKVSGVQAELDKLIADNSALKEKVSQLEQQHPDSSPSVQNDSNILGVGTSDPSVILSPDSVETKDPGVNDPLATADSLIDGNIGKFSDLQVSGLAKLNDINVIGNATVGFLDITGMDPNGGSNIDTITGPLRLQATAQNTLEIMNGKVIVSKEGNITTTGEITAKKLNILTENTDENGDVTKSDSSIGTGILLKGKKSVVISTTALSRASKVFVTPKTLLDYPLVVTGIKAGESFTVEVKSAEDKDVDFDWFIVN